MAYLYRHIRLDTNEPFYIGIGKYEIHSKGNYRRAYQKDKRNILWRNIVNKTEYEVEILLENLSWDQACEKEIEFINLYGRRNLGKGPLVNLTDGGDGRQGKGFKILESDKRKIASGVKKVWDERRKDPNKMLEISKKMGSCKYKTITNNCLECGKEYTTKTSKGKFCSPNCGQRNRRAKNIS